MRSNRYTYLFVALGIVSLLIIGAGTVFAQESIRADGSPELEVYTPENTFTPGQAAELELSIDNDGELTDGQETNRELVTTARSVVVDIDTSDTPISVTSNQRSLGTIPEDQTRETQFGIEIPESAEPGTYEIEIEIDYSYTSEVRISADGFSKQESRSVTKTIEIEIDDQARFRVDNVDSTLRVGEDGEITGEVTNIGQQDATNAEVQFPTASDSIRPLEDAVAVGDVPAGESASFEIPIRATEEAEPVSKRFDLPVSFRDENGIRAEDDNPDLVADIAPRRDRFVVEDVESTLRVGEEGEITGNVTNVGDENATNAEVRFPTESDNIIPLETAVAVGDIPVGESASFRIPIEASSEAEPVSKRFDLPVSYRDEDGVRVQNDDPELLADIAPKRDEFGVEVVDRTIVAGTTTELELEVTNNRDQTVTDVEAKLFTDDPLDSDDDEGFVESLDPGESTTITFELEADSGATAKTYPVSVDFRYDDERGRSKLSDTYRIAIDVTEGEDGGIPGWIFGIGVAALGGLGYAWYRRQ